MGKISIDEIHWPRFNRVQDGSDAPSNHGPFDKDSLEKSDIFEVNGAFENVMEGMLPTLLKL